MLTRIRNAIQIRSEVVYIPKTNMSLSITKILVEEGFIDSFEECSKVFNSDSNINNKFIRICLKYKGIKQVSYITSFKRVSKPGLRVYVGNSKVHRVLGGIGISVFFTLKFFITFFNILFLFCNINFLLSLICLVFLHF